MKRVGVALLCWILAGVAQAQSTVYSSGAPNLSTIWYGDASDTSASQAAAEFTLGSAAVINSINWWGGFTQANAASANDSFQLNIYSATGGTVGSLLATANLGNATETATGRLIQSAPEYSYSASFASIALGSGTYFIGIERSGGPGTWGWESANATAQSLEAVQGSTGAWLYNSGVNLAFSLLGTVSATPEVPTSLMWIFGAGAIGLFARRRYRKTG